MCSIVRFLVPGFSTFCPFRPSSLSWFTHCFYSRKNMLILFVVSFLPKYVNKFRMLRERVYAYAPGWAVCRVIWNIFSGQSDQNPGFKANAGRPSPDHWLGLGLQEASCRASTIQNSFFPLQDILKSLCILTIHVPFYLVRGVGCNPLKSKVAFRRIKFSPQICHYPHTLEPSKYQFPKIGLKILAARVGFYHLGRVKQWLEVE